MKVLQHPAVAYLILVRAMRAGFLAVLTASVMCFHALALAADKLPAANAYNERLKKIANKALRSTLMKHLDRLNGVTMKIHYVVDRDGHVHNVKVTSRTHDSSAENIVADAIASTTFPPIPMDAQLEVGAGYLELDAEVTLAADELSAEKAEIPTYYNYRMQVHKMMQDDLDPSFHAPHHLEVDYEFYLNPQGQVTSMKVHAKAGGQSAEQIISRSIQRIKYPPIPPKVFKELEQKPPLRIYGTLSWDPPQGGGPTESEVYEWQLSEKQALSIANAALAANHIEPARYKWHQQVWRIIDTRDWFIQFSARYPGPGGNDVLVTLNDVSRKASVRVLPLRWSGRVETVVPQYKR